MSRDGELENLNVWTLRQLLSGDLSPGECSTPNVVASATSDYEDFVNIDNISRNYFLMMIKFNESNALRSLFAEETFIDKDGDKASGHWEILPRTYDRLGEKVTQGGETFYYYGPIAPDTVTRHFMTHGISLYRFNLGENTYRFLITGEDMQEKANFAEPIVLDETLSEALGSDIREFKSVFKLFKEVEKLRLDPKSGMEDFTVLERWPGCGMQIPKNVRIELRPNLVWPTLELVTMDENGNRSRVRLANEANEARWFDQSLDENKEPSVGRVISTDKVQQGQTKAILRVKGKVLVGQAPENTEGAPAVETEQGSVTAVATKTAATHENVKKLRAEAKFEDGKPYEIVFGLPFICASFDVLTGLEFSTQDFVTEDSKNIEEIVLFTT